MAWLGRVQEVSRLTGISPNLSAFLDMIAFSEGTPRYGHDDGYNVIVGGSLFDSYADHPRKLIELRPGLKSTAAGRYQLLSRFWDVYKHDLKLPDFSPESQDKVAIQQIRECHALPLIEAGTFEEAVSRCRHIWASFPGAGYLQRENKLSDLIAAFVKAGGAIA